jgi:shikimate kinase
MLESCTEVQDTVIIVLDDTPENILERVAFYDIDSRKVDKTLRDDEWCHYLQEIRDDIRYFKRSWKKANLIIDIAGYFNAENAACRVLEALPTNLMDKNTV